MYFAMFIGCLIAVNGTAQAADPSDPMGANTIDQPGVKSGMSGESSDMNMSAFKESMENRLTVVDKQIDVLKKNSSDMSTSDKENMNMQISQLNGKRTTVNNMISGLKSTASPTNRQAVEDAMTDLENSVKDVSSGKNIPMQR
jgi:hypothetical protein